MVLGRPVSSNLIAFLHVVRTLSTHVLDNSVRWEQKLSREDASFEQPLFWGTVEATLAARVLQTWRQRRRICMPRSGARALSWRRRWRAPRQGRPRQWHGCKRLRPSCGKLRSATSGAEGLLPGQEFDTGTWGARDQCRRSPKSHGNVSKICLTPKFGPHCPSLPHSSAQPTHQELLAVQACCGAFQVGGHRGRGQAGAGQAHRPSFLQHPASSSYPSPHAQPASQPAGQRTSQATEAGFAITIRPHPPVRVPPIVVILPPPLLLLPAAEGW
jgi:hypothetical protein